MFDLDTDSRISVWVDHRRSLDNAVDPLQECWEFWKSAPFVPYNRRVDPFFQRSWPTPWEIIADNKYDDFTKALMISWTLKLTERFKNSKIEIKSFVDSSVARQYNCVFIDNEWIINYDDYTPVHSSKLSKDINWENLISIDRPR